MAAPEMETAELPRPFASGMAHNRRIVRVDTAMASVHLVHAFGALVSPGAIRQWGNRGLITRQERGQYRYDLEEIIEYARARGLLGRS